MARRGVCPGGHAACNVEACLREKSTQAGSKKIARALEAAALEDYGPNDGPAYLIVSVNSPGFVYPQIDRFNGSVINSAEEMGSEVWLIRTGTMITEDHPGVSPDRAEEEVVAHFCS